MARQTPARSRRCWRSWRICEPRASSLTTRRTANTFGLDKPLLEVEWETDRPHRLKVGAQVPREPSYYAATDEGRFVFTLAAETLKPFEAEFRDHLIMSFPPAKAERLVLTWSRPDRTVAFKHRPPAAKGQLEWVDEPGTDASGIDLSAAGALAKALSHLEAVRYAQYDGEIQPFTGLAHPRLTAAVKLGDNEPDRIIRIGHPAAPGLDLCCPGDVSARTGLPTTCWVVGSADPIGPAIIASSQRCLRPGGDEPGSVTRTSRNPRSHLPGRPGRRKGHPFY